LTRLDEEGIRRLFYLAVHLTVPLRRGAHDSSGVTVVEFALVATVAFYVVMGVIEFGLIMTSYISMTTMARDAVRTASVWGSRGNDATYVTPACTVDSHSLISSWTCTCTPVVSSRTLHSLVTCTATTAVPVVVPLISNVTGTSISLSASSTNFSEQ
jgi:Flp pilus assembly protein TadG